MPISGSSLFFNNYKASKEQDLLESLIIEATGIYGEDMMYLPRGIVNKDRLLGADDQSTYSQAIPLCLYIESADQFEGDGSFMSKFAGLEIRDQVTLSVPRKVFKQIVSSVTGQVRPNEGDLIYFPLNDKCFQITFVQKFETFYQLGKLYTWQMTCQLFEYSSEIFNTGVPQIDKIQAMFDNNIYDWAILDTLGNYLTDTDDNIIQQASSGPDKRMAFDDSREIDTEGDEVINWTVENPFSEDDVEEGEVPDSVQPSGGIF
jgi:hypothetical protein